MSAVHVLLAIGAGLAGWGTVRVIRGRRRLLTGLILLGATGSLALWAVLVLHRFAPAASVVAGVLLFLLLPPLSLLAAGLGLLANGVALTRREGLRVSIAVAPVIGVGVITLPLIAFQVIDPHPGTPVWVRVVVAVATLLGVLVLIQLVSFVGYTVLCARAPQRPGAEVIVVLGCGLRGHEVGQLLAKRLNRAAEVYRGEVAHGGTPLLVTSGGQGPGEVVAEADAMADYLEAAGIPGDVLVRENRSRNTEENLRLTIEELRARGLDPLGLPMTVVTSDFHVLRTAALARRFGLDAQVTGARTVRYFVRPAFVREFVAILVRHRRANLVAAAVLLTAVVTVSLSAYLPVGLALLQ
ncbi:YdcF family protein [Nocardia jejuensis]|uniref:YdcF family protein n=1 Tax=Nocardia jejuensis TaxID=328049 RepID=UPI00082D4B6B|nr:YdcF family protein [Nocardia jejuensis]